jgi:hypothetical protein
MSLPKENARKEVFRHFCANERTSAAKLRNIALKTANPNKNRGTQLALRVPNIPATARDPAHRSRERATSLLVLTISLEPRNSLCIFSALGVTKVSTKYE